MKYLVLFSCLFAVVASFYSNTRTSTKKGVRISKKPTTTSKVIYPQLSAQVSPPVSVTKTFGAKSWASGGTSTQMTGRYKGYRRRNNNNGLNRRNNGGFGGGMFGRGGMRALLPLIIGGEAEGMVTVLFLSSLVNGQTDSDHIKLLMLSGRLGEEAQIFGRCLYILRLSKQQCIFFTMMNG